MKIALLTTGIWPLTIGGMQKHTYYLAKNLSIKTTKLDVYYHSSFSKVEDETQFKKYFTLKEHTKINFIKVPKVKSYWFPGHYIYENYLYSCNISKLFLNEVNKYDIIYIQGFPGWELMRRWKTLRKKMPPCIINFHGLNMYQKAFSIKVKLENLLFRPFVKKNILLADYVQSLGGKLTEILNNIVAQNRVLNIGIGIDDSWITSYPSCSNKPIVRFTFVGRNDVAKGIKILSDVIYELLKFNLYSFQFDFIGPITNKSLLPFKNINYHGLIKKPSLIKQLLDDTDVLICPSYSEGMPTVILEAMARGCAIIATDVGAVSALVSNKNGWLIEPGNKSQLRNAMIEAINTDQDKLISMKSISINHVQDNFLWEDVIQEMINEFNRIIHLNSTDD